MRLFLSLIILSLLAACKGKETEVLHLDDIVSKSSYGTGQKADSVPEKAIFKPAIAAADLESARIQWDSVLIDEELTVPERFAPKSTEKFTYWKDNKSVTYNRWVFRDSSATMKAFLNWMNCYGEKCTMIEMRKNSNIQRNAVLILQNDTSIIQVQSASFGLNEFKKWKKMYFEPEDAKWQYILTQPKGGKAVWSKFDNKEETEFVQLETE